MVVAGGLGIFSVTDNYEMLSCNLSLGVRLQFPCTRIDERSRGGMVLFDGIQSGYLFWVEITKFIHYISVLSNSSLRLIREFCGN